MNKKQKKILIKRIIVIGFISMMLLGIFAAGAQSAMVERERSIITQSE